jgi:hypothetical protein
MVISKIANWPNDLSGDAYWAESACSGDSNAIDIQSVS